MKIIPNLSIVNSLNIGAVARESARADRDGENGRDQYTRQQADPDAQNGSTPDNNSDKRGSKQKMEDAVEAFRADPQTQASGISAATEGSGPGLKVVVKDSSGGVIRQFTGEEFLRLREAVSQDKTGRGKILDQKL